MAGPVETEEGPAPNAPPLAATAFAGEYASPMLDRLLDDGANAEIFHHLNCSYFSHSSGQPPTLEQLKQHSQSIAQFILALQTSTVDPDTPAADWLEDSSQPYQNSMQSHQRKLTTVRNRLAQYEDAAGKATFRRGCPINDVGQVHEIADHANELLEVLDHIYRVEGGILGSLPSESDPKRELLKHSLLGRWINFTSALVRRVAAFESEIEQHRIVMAEEAKVPMQLTQGSHQASNGRPLVFPQDRYILSHLSDGLWEHLNERFSAATEEKKSQEAKDKDEIGSTLPEKQDDSLPSGAVSIECKSRLFRVPGQPTIFIVPAYDIDPTLAESRAIEQVPAVVSVQSKTPEAAAAMEQRQIVHRNALIERWTRELQKARAYGWPSYQLVDGMKQDIIGYDLSIKELWKEAAAGRVEVKRLKRKLEAQQEMESESKKAKN